MSIFAKERDGLIKKLQSELSIGSDDAKAKLKVLEDLGADYAKYVEAWYSGKEIDGEANGVTVSEIKEDMDCHYLDAIQYLKLFADDSKAAALYQRGFFFRR